jgi:hypothetical protein
MMNHYLAPKRLCKVGGFRMTTETILEMEVCDLFLNLKTAFRKQITNEAYWDNADEDLYFQPSLSYALIMTLMK